MLSLQQLDEKYFYSPMLHRRQAVKALLAKREQSFSASLINI